MKEKTIKMPKPKQKESGSSCSYCTCIFVGFILIVFGLTALNLHQFVFRYRYHDLNALGEFSLRNIVDDINSFLCHAYKVTPAESANVYLLKGHAKVDRKHKITMKRTTNQLIPNSLYLKNAFYLLEGSHIHVNGCKTNLPFHDFDTAELLLFRGDRAWKKFTEGKCHDCHLKRVQIQADDLCGVTSEHMSYSVKKRDTFYIALTKKGDTSGFKADATIKRTTFDLKHVEESCFSTIDCYLNLTYGKPMDVVVQFSDDVTLGSFGTECKYRTMIWIVVFLLAPASLISLSVCCCCCCACANKGKKSKKGRQPTLYTASTADILANEYPPDYQSITKGSIQNV